MVVLETKITKSELVDFLFGDILQIEKIGNEK
jgi:hypothetical protein